MNFTKIIQKYQYITPAAFLWIAGMIGNIFNWLFNFLATRSLTIESFANLTFFTTLQYLISIFTVSLMITTNRFFGDNNKTPISRLGGYSIILGLLSTLIYLFTAKYWAPLVNYPTTNTFLVLTAPMFFLMFTLSWMRGIINGSDLLILSGWTIIIEGLTKLLIGVVGYLQFPTITFLAISIPVSLLTPTVFLFYIFKKKVKISPIEYSLKLPKDLVRFYAQSILLQIGVIAIINIDIIIINRFLDPTQAGIYSLLSLIGKTLFFINYTFAGLLVPLVSNRIGSEISSRKPFIIIIFITILSSIIFTTISVLAPQYSIKVLIGEKYMLVNQYLLRYCISISTLSISLIFSTYYLLKQKYLLSTLIFIVVLLEGFLMSIFHRSITDIINTLLFTTSLLTVMMLIITFTDKNNLSAIRSLRSHEKNASR